MGKLAAAALALGLGALLAWAVTAKASREKADNASTPTTSFPAGIKELTPSAEPARARVTAHEAAKQRLESLAPDQVQGGGLPTGAGTALVGRLLDEAELPVRNWKVRVWLTTDRGTLESSVQTDADGRFRHALTAVALQMVPRSLQLGIHSPETSLHVPALLPQGDYDLGDVRLATGPFVVSGSIVDEDYHPVPATIRVERAETDPRWAKPIAELRSDSAGRFRLAGDPRGLGALRLAAEADGLRSDPPVECLAGSEDIVIILARTGALSVRLVPPKGLTAHNFRSELSIAQVVDSSIDRDGVTKWLGLRPGAYTCVVRTALQGAVVARVDGISVGAGTSPASREIDLTGLAVPVVVSVVDENGGSLAGARLEVHHPAGGSSSPRSASHWVLARAVGEPIKLTVRAQGYRPVSLSDVYTDQEITLQPGIRTVLSLLGNKPLTRGKQHASVLLTKIGIDSERMIYENVTAGPFDGARQATVILPGPGQYIVSWGVGHSEGATYMVGETSIDIPETDEDLVFELAPPADLAHRLETADKLDQ